ncbi:MAG: nucleotidyltransferase domain-containing protein [Muribaculaceae bacterium]|nr:nucleotidyltransferase domain-containing protein [Muribaculaceae bacterium]
MKLIELNLEKIHELCRKYKVKTLSVFGSILTDRFNDESDVDFLFRFESDVDYNNYADLYFSLLDEFRVLFGREVDLVDEKTLHNPYFIAEVESTKQSIYG